MPHIPNLLFHGLNFFCTVYKPGSETDLELPTAATTGDHVVNDAVPTLYLGQEVLTKHSTLQSNGEHMYITLLQVCPSC